MSDQATETGPVSARSEEGTGSEASFALPTGTVAFLLTDVEGSTRTWEAEPDAMATAMDQHNAILSRVVAARGGVCPPAQGEGDSIVAAFTRASDAVLAAADAQRAFTDETWPTTSPLRVRMAIHAGEARFVDDGNYAGHAIIRTARLRAVAHGGQVLVSSSAHDLTVDELGDAAVFRDLGEHRLRDLARPERVWQLVGDGLPDDFAELRSLDHHSHNLPVQLSSFVGRTEETRTLVRLMRTERLVTITGAGGAGKTRLAQQVAAELLDSFAAGAWWIELGPLTSGDEIPGAIARATGTKGEVGGEAIDALVERLEGVRLLVFDNCEHVVNEVAELVDVLLRRCGDLKVLATSREPLAVDGELAWRIPPLAVPPSSGAADSIELLGQFDAVRLFLERAQRVRRNFHLNDDNGPAVADICHRLDGIPLAIELAASRCRSLHPRQIRDGLTESFDLLTGGTRAALPRQRTLEASIDWSHRLLTEPERLLFRRLATFQDGCTLDDIEAVVADEALAVTEILDLLDRLIAQSLVTVDDAGPSERYRMLETVRQFATRELRVADESEALADRHADHYVAVLLRIGPHAENAFNVDEFRWMVSEMENLSHAIRRAVAAGRLADAVDCGWYLSLVWGLVDPPAGDRLLDDVAAALTAVDDDGLDVRLKLARTQLHLWAGNLLRSATEAVGCIEAAERQGDDWAAMRARAYLGQVVAWVDPDEGLRMHQTAREQARALEDPVGEILATAGLASAYVGILSDLVSAKPWIDESIELADRLGHPLLQSWSASQQALWCAFAGQLPDAERWAAVADRCLDVVGDGLGPGGAQVMSRSVIRSSTILAQSYSRAQSEEHRDWFASLPEQSARSAAAGYLVTPAMLELIHGIQMAYSGCLVDAEASLARGRVINERAGTEAVGVAGAIYWVDLALAAGELAEAKRRIATTDGSMIAARSVHARARRAKRLAAFALIEGTPLEAEREAHEGLTLVAAQGIPLETFELLEVLAQVAAVTGAPDEAARIAGAVAAIRARHGITVRLAWHADQFDAALAEVRSTLGAEAFAAAFAEGEAMSMAEAVAYVQRARGERKRPSFGWEGLTPTEEKVVGHVADGLTNPQIAEAMFISRETVKTHLSHVFAKLGVSSRSALAAEATRRATSEQTEG